MKLFVLATVLGVSIVSSSSSFGAEARDPEQDGSVIDRGDLFPGAGQPTVAGATGLPFLAIGEAGIGITSGVAVGVIGGLTPSVWTVGMRPRFRVATSERTALVIDAPMLFYPKASAPGPGNVGTTSWVLSRAQLFFDGALGERWHVAGGVGVIAAASTEALGQFLSGNDFRMPPYDGTNEARRGFAGGIWNTVAARGSYALGTRTHVFGEATVVMDGIALADGVGGPPFVVNVGLQHGF